MTSQIIFWESSIPVGRGMRQGNGVLLPAWRRGSFRCVSTCVLTSHWPGWQKYGRQLLGELSRNNVLWCNNISNDWRFCSTDAIHKSKKMWMKLLFVYWSRFLLYESVSSTRLLVFLMEPLWLICVVNVCVTYRYRRGLCGHHSGFYCKLSVTH